jgi:hypothetical protein
VKLRRYTILCVFLAVLASLGGTVVASAQTRHRHRRHHRHHRHHHRVTAHKASVLPYMGPSPSPSIFGINTGTYDSNQSNWLRNFPMAHSMGARWLHFTQGSVHFSGGQVNWGTLDSEVVRAKKLGMGVLVSLGGEPGACSITPRPSNFTGCPPTTAGDLYAYSLFLRAELLRYRNVVQYYESWLEPNNPAYWRGGPSAQQYANLLKTEYQVFQQVNSQYHTDLKLLFAGPISFSTAPGSGGPTAVLPYVNQVLNDLHGAHVFDAIGLHGYRFPSDNNGPASLDWGPNAVNWDYVAGLSFPEGDGCSGGALWCKMTWPQELRAYEQVFENHGYGQMPLWLTEFGWPGNASPSTALYPSFDTQTQYLREAYDDILQLPFIQAAFWFNLQDYQPGISSPDPAFFFHYGLFQYGFAPKPAASLFEQFVQANPGR